MFDLIKSSFKIYLISVQELFLSFSSLIDDLRIDIHSVRPLSNQHRKRGKVETNEDT